MNHLRSIRDSFLSEIGVSLLRERAREEALMMRLSAFSEEHLNRGRAPLQELCRERVLINSLEELATTGWRARFRKSLEEALPSLNLLRWWALVHRVELTALTSLCQRLGAFEAPPIAFIEAISQVLEPRAHLDEREV